MKNLIKKNYHWVVAFIVFLEMIVFGGLINSANVFVIPICDSLQVSRGSYALATVPYTLVCCLGTVFSGFLFQHFGYKRSAIASMLVVAASLVMTAMSKSLFMFGLSKVIFALGYGVCFTAGAVHIVKDWFFQHQGLVLGAVSMATGLGGSLMTIILTEIMEKSDWRIANLVAAAMMAVVLVLYFFISDRPEHRGLRPFGFGHLPKNKKKIRKGTYDWPGLDRKELLKHPAFYLMMICVLASCTCIYITSSVAIPHFRSAGFSASEAASYQSVLMLGLAVAKLIFGGLCDRYGAKSMTIICMACAVIGQGMLSVTTDPVLCFVAMGFFAVGMCMTALMIPLLAAPLFGYQTCLHVNGVFLSMASLASIFANPISNTCFDVIGSYMPAFRVAAIVNIGVTGLFFLLFLEAKKEKNKYFDQMESK